MILKKVAGMQQMYTTVKGGCSVTKLLVKSDRVTVGGRSMSIEDIVEIIRTAK